MHQRSNWSKKSSNPPYFIVELFINIVDFTATVMMGRKNQGIKMPKLRKCSENPPINTTRGLLRKGICTRSMTRVECGINRLNDDCLREIFSYLTKRQLIGIERVCKKWKDVSLRLWSTKTLLDYQTLSEISSQMTFTFNIAHFKCILLRCGNHLKTLNLNHENLSHLDKSQAKAIISFICHYCKNLKHLSLNGEIVTQKGLIMLEKAIAPNLESFEISSFNFEINDDSLLRFLQKAEKLDALNVKGNSQISGDSLVKSKKAFKKLNISHCYGISHADAIKILDNSPNLEVLESPAYFTFDLLNQRPLRKHLTKLDLFESNFFKDVTPFASPFPNLSFLTLEKDCSVNNDILSKFDKWFPNLEGLGLIECEYTKGDGKQLDNEGIKELVKLPKLKELNFYSTPWLTSETLVYMAVNTNGRFEYLGCCKSPELYDTDMIKIVSLCPNLKFLDLSYCKNITDEFLAGVVNHMDLRTSNKPLKIKITSSSICDVAMYENRHPLLVLEKFGHLESDDDDSSSDSLSSDEDGSSYLSDVSTDSSYDNYIQDILGLNLNFFFNYNFGSGSENEDSSENDDFF